MNLGVPLKGQNVSYWAKSPIFAHKNIHFGIFVPGAVPRSSALCLSFLDLDCPRSSSTLALLVGILLLTVSALSLSLLSPPLSFSPSSVSLFFLFHNKVIHGECFFSMSLLVLFCFLNKLTSWCILLEFLGILGFTQVRYSTFIDK